MLNKMLSGGSSGKAKVNSTTNNIRLGNQAGVTLGADDTYNIAIGNNAMISVSDVNSGADGNIALGHQSMYSLTGGDNNIGLGNYTLGSITEGDFNIAIGWNAASTKVAGIHDIAIGAGTMLYYIGTALAGGNIAIGLDSQKYNQYGVENIAIGSGSMEGNTSNKLALADYGNVAIGFRSLRDIKTGARLNTSIGNQSGEDLTTAENNTFIGAMAGNTVTSGDNNICIGKDADTSTGTTSNSIAIGNNAKAANGSVSIIPSDPPWSTTYDSILFRYGLKRYKVFEKELTMSDATDGAVACSTINSRIPNMSIVTYVAIEVVTLSDNAVFDVRFGTTSDTSIKTDGTVMPNHVELLGPNIPSCRSSNVLESGTSPAIQLGTTAGVVKRWYTSKPDVLLDDTTLGGSGWDGYPTFVQHGTSNGDANPSQAAKVRVYMEYHGTD